MENCENTTALYKMKCYRVNGNDYFELDIQVNTNEKFLPKTPIAKAPKISKDRLFELIAEAAERESPSLWTKNELMKMSQSEFINECSEFFPLWFEEVGVPMGVCGDYVAFEQCADVETDAPEENGEVTLFTLCRECGVNQICLLGFRTLENGLTILGGSIGRAGAEGHLVVIFYDGEGVKMYVPRYGNSINADLGCRIGDEWRSTVNSIKLEDDGETVILDREKEFGELIRRCPYLAPLMDTPIKISRDADGELSDTDIRDMVDGEVLRQIISLYLKNQGIDIDAETLGKCCRIDFIAPFELLRKDILAAIEVVD